MTVDRSKLNFYSGDRTDQIIGITSGSLSLSVGDLFGPSTVTDTFDTNFGETCFWDGIFTVDGGTTWNSFGSMAGASVAALQTQTVSAYMVGEVMTIVGANYDTSNTFTASYKIALFAKDDQGPLTPISITDNIFFDSSDNYQKIFKSDSFTSSTSTATTVTHSLGVIPNVRAFFVPTSSASGLGGAVTLPAGSLTSIDWYANPSIEISTSSITFNPIADNSSYPDGIAGTMYYRIYYDN